MYTVNGGYLFIWQKICIVFPDLFLYESYLSAAF